MELATDEMALARRWIQQLFEQESALLEEE
jgi:hypothetical protein